MAGASSIDGGITVSLEHFQQVVVSGDRKTVEVGPGLRWVDVYMAVEKHGLSVAGGRVSLRHPSSDLVSLQLIAR